MRLIEKEGELLICLDRPLSPDQVPLKGRDHKTKAMERQKDSNDDDDDGDDDDCDVGADDDCDDDGAMI